MSFKDTVPAGDYWIGDPCYVFPNDGPMSDRWERLLEVSDFLDGAMPAEIDDGKIKVWTAATAYGDGEYVSADGSDRFSVDSGLLGIVPMETVRYLNRTGGDLSRLGKFVTFNEPTTVKADGGYFRFGSIVIDTMSEFDEDEDEE